MLSSAKFLSSPPAFPASTCGDLKAELSVVAFMKIMQDSNHATLMLRPL